MVKYKVKEGEALRNIENLRKELTLLSSVACGARAPFLWKGALALRHIPLVTQNKIP